MADEKTAEQLQVAVQTLTQQLAERDQAFGVLKTRLEIAEKAATGAKAATDQATALTTSLSNATGKYQALLAQANPDIPAELIKGSTVEELDSSLASSKVIVQKVRESLEAQAQAIQIPAGAPARGGLDLASLSPDAKIKVGLEQHDKKLH